MNFVNNYSSEEFIDLVNLLMDNSSDNKRTTKLQQEVEERRKIEAELEIRNKQLKESQLHLQTIFDGAIMGIVVLNYETGISLCNAALQQMLGYTGDELRTMNFRDFTHPDDLERELDLFKTVMDTGVDKYQLEKRYIRKDKSIIWGRLSLTIIRNSLNNIKFIIALVENITQRKIADQALRESEEKFRNLFENSMDGICITKPDGTTVSANPAICDLLGMTEEEI